MTNSEDSRIQFYINRDGLESAKDSIRMILKVYRKSVLCSKKRGHFKPHHASTREFRQAFIDSYLQFKRFLQNEKTRPFLQPNPPTT